jgi:hypothetical protein
MLNSGAKTAQRTLGVSSSLFPEVVNLRNALGYKVGLVRLSKDLGKKPHFETNLSLKKWFAKDYEFLDLRHKFPIKIIL